MQVLDPRNQAIYEFANVNPKKGKAIKVYNDKHKYVKLISIDSAYKRVKGTGYYYQAVADRLIARIFKN